MLGHAVPVRRSAAGGSRRGARGSGARSGPAPLISRLQSTAGNRAVVQLLAADPDIGPVDQLPAGGNRATARLLAPGARGPRGAPRPTVQLEDEKKKPEPKPDAKAETKAGASPNTKALRKAWDDAGLVAGGKLFDLINDDLSLAKLLDMGLPELAGLAGEGAAAGFEKATEAGGSKGEVKPIGLETKEVKQVGEALAGWAVKAADKWLKSEGGRKFLAKAQGFINEHPKAAYWTIVSTLALGIAGAVTGYFMGAFDPKEFKKQFEIRGLKIDAAVDLGNFKERVLQSGKLAMSGKAGPGTLSVEGTAKTVTGEKDKTKQGYDVGVTGKYAVGDEKKGPAGSISAGYAYNTLKDQSQVSLGAGFKYKPLTLDTTWKFQGDGSGVLDTSVTGKLSDNLTLTGQTTVGAYGPASRDTPLGYKLSLTSTKGKDSDKVSLDMDAKTKVVTFGAEQTRTLWGGSLTTTTSLPTLGTAGSTVAGMSYARSALKMDLKYTLDKAGKSTLDVGASGKGEGVEAAFAGRFGLETGELEKLTVHLGFGTPDETLKFLHDMSVEIVEGKVESKATETIKVRLKRIAIEVSGSVSESKGKPGAGISTDVGWKLPSGLILGVGASATLTPGKEGVPAPWLVGPSLSVSHEALPIRLVGGVNVPVGPGSEGLPPVFGLSVSPNFEFWSEKKKK